MYQCCDFTQCDFKLRPYYIIFHFSTLQRPKPVRAFNKPFVKPKTSLPSVLDWMLLIDDDKMGANSSLGGGGSLLTNSLTP